MEPVKASPVDLILHAIVGLSDGGRRKGVGLADVCSRLEILMVNLVNGFRPAVEERELDICALEWQYKAVTDVSY